MSQWVPQGRLQWMSQGMPHGNPFTKKLKRYEHGLEYDLVCNILFDGVSYETCSLCATQKRMVCYQGKSSFS